MRLGILTFGDEGDGLEAQGRLAAWLEEQGHHVVPGESVVATEASATSAAERSARAHCDVVVFLLQSQALPCPDLCVSAALHVNAPILLLGSAEVPAPVWEFAGALREIGVVFGRVLGDPDAADTRAGIAGWLHDHDGEARQRGEDAAQKLYGQRFGALIAPPQRVDASQWLSQFGIHVRHFDRAVIRERSRQVGAEQVETLLHWLRDHCRDIACDNHTLTHQARLYLGLRDLLADAGIDFCALPEWVTLDDGETLATAPARALLNDGAHREPDKPLVCAPGGDGNGALTMQLLHLVSQAPVLSAVLSRYDAVSGRLDGEDDGGHAPFFAKRAEDAAENWRAATLRPARKGEGAAVDFALRAADVATFARITRRSGRFVATLLRGGFAPEAPQLRLDCPFERLAATWASSRVHAVVGDHLAAMLAACEALDIETVVL